MPVKIPDPSVHKICMRCRQWFEPDEGKMILREAGGPISGMTMAAASIAGIESQKRFICWKCHRARRLTKTVLWIAFFVAIGIALLVAWLQGRH